MLNLQLAKTGYARLVTKLKRQGVMKMEEGKRALKFPCLALLAKTCLTALEDPMLNMASSLFLLLCWNLSCRSISVSTLTFACFGWGEDAMLIKFAGDKVDQQGLSTNFPRRVFANRFRPEICPVLSLGIYVFASNSFRGKAVAGAESPLLFHNLGFESKFSQWLTATKKVEHVATQFKEHGMAVEDTGTHSLKFVVCLCAH